LSIHTQDVFYDTGADAEALVSHAFAKKLKERMGARIWQNNEVYAIGDYRAQQTEVLKETVCCTLQVQGKEIRNQHFILADISHDVLLGRIWFQKHDTFIDSKRRRLLFPADFPEVSKFVRNIEVTAQHLMSKPEWDQQVLDREKAMQEEDQRRRSGRESIGAVNRRIQQLEQKAKEKKSVSWAEPLETTITSPFHPREILRRALPFLSTLKNKDPDLETGTTCLYEIDRLIEQKKAELLPNDTKELREKVMRGVPKEYHDYLDV
ncbi:hypothetical protein QBC37DRAFT_262382, partial [Rhypophila decipiens]